MNPIPLNSTAPAHLHPDLSPEGDAEAVRDLVAETRRRYGKRAHSDRLRVLLAGGRHEPLPEVPRLTRRERSQLGQAGRLGARAWWHRAPARLELLAAVVAAYDEAQAEGGTGELIRQHRAELAQHLEMAGAA